MLLQHLLLFLSSNEEYNRIIHDACYHQNREEDAEDPDEQKFGFFSFIFHDVPPYSMVSCMARMSFSARRVPVAGSLYLR